jgi:HSP20 family protein
MTTEALTAKQENPLAESEPTRSGPCYRPRVDILERGEDLLVLADMPGVEPEGIDIDFEDGVLTIQGVAKSRQAEGVRYLRRDYPVGDYYRTFRVSEKIDASKITADYQAGVLTLCLPKTEALKPRKIDVAVS